MLSKIKIIIFICIATSSILTINSMEGLEKFGPDYQIEIDKNSGPGLYLNGD